MEDLLTKIAELLDMSVDGVLENYPILRGQFVQIYPLENISYLLQGIIAVGVLLLFTFGTIAMFKKIDWGSVDSSHIKLLVMLTVVVVVALALFLLINYLMIRMAPDLMFLERLL